MELFESFFGTTNYKNISLDSEGRQISLIEKVESDLHKDYIPQTSVKAKDITKSLWCTLHEFFHGSKKTVQYERFSVTGSSLHQIGFGAQISNERVTKQIDVMPGMRDGTKLRFPGWGNNPALKTKGDLVIILRRTDHESMVRQVDDLIYKHPISMKDALCGGSVIEFKTLDGEILKYQPEGVINPQMCKVFPGKGMPIYVDDPLSPLLNAHARGNFILKFKIEMPNSLTDEQRNNLKQVLLQ